MESGQQDKASRFTNREQVGTSIVWQIKRVSLRMLLGAPLQESLDTVDLDTVECSDYGRIENVIWLNFSVHAVPLGINSPAR